VIIYPLTRMLWNAPRCAIPGRADTRQWRNFPLWDAKFFSLETWRTVQYASPRNPMSVMQTHGSKLSKGRERLSVQSTHRVKSRLYRAACTSPASSSCHSPEVCFASLETRSRRVATVGTGKPRFLPDNTTPKDSLRRCLHLYFERRCRPPGRSRR
jgi:hypothetical protein